MNTIVDYSERLYSALLSLYPLEFRLRFGPEMAQVFRDCCHDALQKGEVAILAAFLLQTLRDLCASAFRERSRGIVQPLNAGHPLMTLVDSLLIPGIVTLNLVALGPILTLLIQGGPALETPMDQFMLTSGFFSFVIGTSAVIASLVFTKLRPTVRLWVRLSA
jgi:hypothetical protein